MVFHSLKNQRKTAIIASVIGEIMEWYDFALYGFMASIISQLFFPSGSKAASLLATYGIFAAGFIMRPIGSVLFGWLGDTIGRTRTMLISVSMMLIPTVTLGILPTYQSVGIWAPVLLVIIRMMQGLSVGGEFSTSVTYLVETAPENKRGLSGSFANLGSTFGMLLGSAMATTITSLLDDSLVKAWGWRLPFLLGGVLGILAVYLRRKLPESSHFSEHERKREESSPIKEVFTQNAKQVVQGFLFASSYGALFYTTMVYLPTWLSEHTMIALNQAMLFNTIATVILLPLIPITGWISDRLIRRTHFLGFCVAVSAAIAFPLMIWMRSGNIVAALITQLTFGVIMAIPLGVAPATFVELFPTRDRLSGYSVSFNLGMGIIGGTTPMAVTWLISLTGSNIAPAAYMSLWGIIGLVALTLMQDRSREPLQ